MEKYQKLDLCNFIEHKVCQEFIVWGLKDFYGDKILMNNRKD